MSDPIHEPLQLGGQFVPGVWRYLLPDDLLALRLPSERRASCGACPKIASDGFRADYRCCTYHPRIPNFLLGLALESGREVATKAVRDLVAQAFVLPEGTERSPAKWLAILRQERDDAYGKDDHVLCPLLDTSNGFCRVHAFRNSVCSTYFCLFDHGAQGSRLWEVLLEYVSGAESALAQWALSAAGFDVPAYFARFDGLADDLDAANGARDDCWSDAALKLLWGDAYGHEEELLRATARAVSANRDDLRHLVEQTTIQRPARFEAAEIHGAPADLQAAIDARDRLALDAEVTAPVPLSEYAELLREAVDDLRGMPPPKTLVALAEGVTIVGDRVFFRAQEGPEGEPAAVWDLDLLPGEAAALAAFSTPRPLRVARRAFAKQKDLDDFEDFLSRWRGYGVLAVGPTPDLDTRE